jgi:hypothetical protein
MEHIGSHLKVVLGSESLPASNNQGVSDFLTTLQWRCSGVTLHLDDLPADMGQCSHFFFED